MIQLALDGYADRAQHLEKVAKWHMWHIGIFPRLKEMPSFAEMMGLDEVDVVEMGDEELEADLDRWFARHNAKLTPDQTHYVVAELVEEE